MRYRRVHGVGRPTAANTNGCHSGRLTSFVFVEIFHIFLGIVYKIEFHGGWQTVHRLT